MAKAQKVQVAQEEVVVVEVAPVPTDEKGRKTVVNKSMEEVEQKGWKNKSQIMRGLNAEGYSPSAIAKFLNVRYQFVRNVLTKPMKRQ